MSFQAPKCHACGAEMIFIRTTLGGGRGLAQWRCSEGHQNRYAYTRRVPVRYSVEVFDPSVRRRSRQVYPEFFTLEEVQMFLRSYRTFADQFKRAFQFRVKDLRAGKHIRTPHADE